MSRFLPTDNNCYEPSFRFVSSVVSGRMHYTQERENLEFSIFDIFLVVDMCDGCFEQVSGRPVELMYYETHLTYGAR